MSNGLLELRDSLTEKPRDELNIIAKTLRIRGFRKLTKVALVGELLKTDEHNLRKRLSITWWDKHHNHVYGGGSVGLALVGIGLAVGFFWQTPDFDRVLTKIETIVVSDSWVLPVDDPLLAPIAARLQESIESIRRNGTVPFNMGIANVDVNGIPNVVSPNITVRDSSPLLPNLDEKELTLGRVVPEFLHFLDIEVAVFLTDIDPREFVPFGFSAAATPDLRFTASAEGFNLNYEEHGNILRVSRHGMEAEDIEASGNLIATKDLLGARVIVSVRGIGGIEGVEGSEAAAQRLHESVTPLWVRLTINNQEFTLHSEHFRRQELDSGSSIFVSDLPTDEEAFNEMFRSPP